MFAKYLLKNIKERKSRFILVCLTIAIITALLYMLLSSNDVVEKEARKSLSSEYGTTNIIIKSDSDKNNYFITEKVEDDEIDKKVSLCWISAEVEQDQVLYDIDLVGINDTDLDILVDYEVVSYTEQCHNKRVTVSENAADTLGLNLGDDFIISILGTDYNFSVGAIAKNIGYFYDESTSMKILIEQNTLTNMLSLNYETNLEYIKLKNDDEANINSTIERLEKKYEALEFKMVNSSLLTDTLNSNLKMPLLIILLVGCAISILIIYTTTNVVITERLSCIGTYLSIGYSMNKVIFSLVLEAVAQSILGGLLGIIVGIYFTPILIAGMPSSLNELFTRADINLIYAGEGLLFSILLGGISTFITVRKINKYSIKEIILNLTKKKMLRFNLKSILIRLAFLLVLFITGFILRETVIGNVLVILGSILFVFLFLSIVLDFISNTLLKSVRNKFTYFYVACKNVCTMPMLINNIKMVVTTLALVSLIATISNSVISGFNELLTDFQADITVYLNGKVPEVHEYFEEANEVKNKYNIIFMENIKVKEDENNISNVQGIEWQNYQNYNTYFTYIGGKEILKDLKSSDKNIILSQALLKKFDKNIGERIELQSKYGEWVTYTITGAVNAKISYVGSVALISESNAREDFSDDYINAVCLKLKENYDIDTFYNKLKRSEISDQIQSISLDYVKNSNDLVMTKSFLNVIESVSFVAILLSIIGILNNNLICFMQRKITFATLESIGITNNGKKIIMLYESVVMSVLCVLISFAMYWIITTNIQGVLNYIGVYIDVKCNIRIFGIYAVLVVMELVISNIVIVNKISKMSIVEELKYE